MKLFKAKIDHFDKAFMRLKKTCHITAPKLCTSACAQAVVKLDHFWEKNDEVGRMLIFKCAATGLERDFIVSEMQEEHQSIINQLVPEEKE